MGFEFFEPFGKDRYRSRLPVSFDNSMDIYEQILAVINQLDKVMEQSNVVSSEVLKLRKQFVDFKELIEGSLLPENIKKTLEEWLISGKLQIIIGEVLQTQIDDVEEVLKTTQKYPVKSSEFSVLNQSYPYGDVRRYGAVGDGLTVDTLAIKNALKSVEVVSLIDGNYLVDSPITIPYKKTIKCNEDGWLVSVDDIDMVKLEAQSGFIDMNVRVKNLNYNKDVIEFSSKTLALNPDREPPVIRNLYVKLDRPDWNQAGGTIFHIWATAKDSNSVLYKHFGFCFLRILNVVVDGGIKYFSREYTYRHTSINSDADGWLTDTFYENCRVNSAKHTIFGSKDESTITDTHYRSADFNHYNNMVTQGGDSNSMFFFTGGNHFIGEFMPWDWRKKVSTEAPIKVLAGSNTKITLPYLPLSGTLTSTVSLTSYPDYIVLDNQKIQEVKKYLSASSDLSTVNTSAFTKVSPQSRSITGFTSGDLVLLGEAPANTRNYLTFMFNDVYTSSVSGRQESKVTVLWNDNASTGSYFTEPFIDIDSLGVLSFKTEVVSGKKVVRFYFTFNKTSANTQFYSITPKEDQENNWTGVVPFTPRKVSSVTGLTNIVKNTGSLLLPVFSKSNNPYGQKGSIIYDEDTDRIVFKRNPVTTEWVGLLEQKAGSTAGRPTNIQTGYVYFDTTIGSPVWFDGVKWVNGIGSTV